MVPFRFRCHPRRHSKIGILFFGAKASSLSEDQCLRLLVLSKTQSINKNARELLASRAASKSLKDFLLRLHILGSQGGPRRPCTHGRARGNRNSLGNERHHCLYRLNHLPKLSSRNVRQLATLALRAGPSAQPTSICGSPAGDRGHHQHAISLLKLVFVAAKEADVFLVDVDVHEAPHLPRIVAQVLDDGRKPLSRFLRAVREVSPNCIRSIGRRR